MNPTLALVLVTLATPPLDESDPWTDEPVVVVRTPALIAGPLDESDPWTGERLDAKDAFR